MDHHARAILAVDLGSAYVGLVRATAELPLQPVACTIPVDPTNLGVAVRWIVACAEGVNLVLVEHGRFYAPALENPGATAATASAIGQRWGVCERLDERLKIALTEERGIEIEHINRQTWAHRVVTHQRKGITDAMVREAMSNYVVGMASLSTQHEIDSAGAMIGYIIGSPKKESKHRACVARSYTRKLGTRRMRKGHPSDEAFDKLMTSIESANRDCQSG